MSQPSRPIIVVTGANGGVGFGICQRLLFQLCHTSPSDAQPQNFVGRGIDVDPSFQLPPPGYDGLTLIMACRNAKYAEAARAKLLWLLEMYVLKLKEQSGYDGHAEMFQKNVVIDTRSLDLAIVGSVINFAAGVSQTYPYVSHLICNAGVISFKSMDWVAAWKQVFTDFVGAITAPVYVRQHIGELSVDGIGLVWQCNLFGHYALYRALQPLLSSPASPYPGRVIWMSSLEASPRFYRGLDDWQTTKTEFSYQNSKYQMDLLATHLDQISLAHARESSSHAGPIRHFVTDPGICSTKVNRDMIGPFMDTLKHIFFYIARLFGSPNHTIDPFVAAIGAVHLSLAPLVLFTSLLPRATYSSDAEPAQSSTPVKFGAAASRWGAARIKLVEIKEWEENKGDAAELLVKCEELYQSFRKAEEVTVDYDTSADRM